MKKNPSATVGHSWEKETVTSIPAALICEIIGVPITESAVEYLVGITAEWTAQQLREAFPFDQVPRYLLRDRDGIFVVSFTRTWKRWPGRVGGVIGETQASPTGHLEALDSV